MHADSRKLEVKFNYEFLEDFQDKQSSGEEGPTNKETRYPQSAQILSPLVIVISCFPTAKIPGSQRNLQNTVTHSFWSWVSHVSGVALSVACNLSLVMLTF